MSLASCPPSDAELERLAQLHQASFTSPPPWSKSEIAGFLSLPYAFLLTAEAKGQIGGFLIGTAVAGEAELVTLAVDPTLRRLGLGRDLVTRFICAAKSRAAETAFLEVSAANPAAIALYESIGFARNGLRRGYYRKPTGETVDAILMAHALEANKPSAAP